MIEFTRLVKGRLSTLVSFCMLAALFIGGAQHGAGSIFAAPWDKLAHIVFFLSLTLFLSGGFNVSIAIIAMLAILIGVLDELHQVWLPGRFPGLDDWLADIVGVGLAIGILYFRKR